MNSHIYMTRVCRRSPSVSHTISLTVCCMSEIDIFIRLAIEQARLSRFDRYIYRMKFYDRNSNKDLGI